MKQIVIIGTMLLTASLLISGIYYPNSPLMWLASTSLNYQIIRAVLLVLLAILLFSHPPRALWFRWLLGAVAVGLFGSTVQLALTDTMNIVDMPVFVEVAIIFGIEALEDRRPLLHRTRHATR